MDTSQKNSLNRLRLRSEHCDLKKEAVKSLHKDNTQITKRRNLHFTNYNLILSQTYLDTYKLPQYNVTLFITTLRIIPKGIVIETIDLM